MINISDKSIDNTTATCINRGTLRAKGDAYKIFIDQTVQFLSKNKGFIETFKRCIEPEVWAVAKNHAKHELVKRGLSEKGTVEKNIDPTKKGISGPRGKKEKESTNADKKKNNEEQNKIEYPAKLTADSELLKFDKEFKEGEENSND